MLKRMGFGLEEFGFFNHRTGEKTGKKGFGDGVLHEMEACGRRDARRFYYVEA